MPNDKRQMPNLRFGIRYSTFVILLLTLLAFIAPAYGQGVTLKYRWTKGEVLTYRALMQTTSVVSGMPGMGEMKIDQSLSQVTKMTTVDIAADGTTTLRESFESMKMEMDGPMGHISYDTAAPSGLANPMIQAMRKVLDAIVGASLTIVQAPDGSIRKLEGTTSIIDQISKNTSGDPSAAMAAQGMKAAFSDEAIKTTLEQTFSKLPADPVRPGDTWKGQTAMGNEMIGRIVGNVTFTLKSVEGPADAGLARIDIALVLKQEIAPPPGPNGMTMKLGDARGTGEIVFDLAKGRIRESRMKSDLPSRMSMQAPDGTTANMENKTTTTVTMTLVEK
jgi:hypothetical protein